MPWLGPLKHKPLEKNTMKKKTAIQLIDALIENNYYDLYDALADNHLESKELFEELSTTNDLETALRILRRETMHHLTPCLP